MFDRKIVFSGYGVKVLGPRIGGGPVDDFTDLIDGDGDGKCKERGGNFIPCPPRIIVEVFQDYQARLNRLRKLTSASDQAGNRYLSEIQGAIDVNIGHLRGNRPNWVDDTTLRQLLEEAEERLRGKPKAPARQAAPANRNPDDDLAGLRAPRDLVELVRDLRQRVQRFDDEDGRLIARGIEREVERLRGGDRQANGHAAARRLLGELEQLIRGREQNAPNTDQARLAPAERYQNLVERVRNLIRDGLDGDDLRAAQEAHDRYTANMNNENLGKFERLVARLENGQPARQTGPAQQAAEAAEAVVPVDVDAIIQERRKTAKAKAKKITENAKKFIPQEIRNYFQRRSINNMDRWLTGTPQEKSAKFDKWARRMFENTFEDRDGRKYTVKLSSVSFSGGRGSIQGTIYDPNGRPAGNFTRYLNLDRKYVDHAVFKMNDDQQGNGIGSAFVRASEILYKKAGFEQIKVSGLSQPGWSGATHWPKMGFDWEDEMWKRTFLSKVESAVRQYDANKFSSRQEFEEIRALLQRARQDSLDDPNRVLPGDLLRFKGAERHFQSDGGISIHYVLKL